MFRRSHQILLLLCILAITQAIPVIAGDPSATMTITSFSITCTSARVTYTAPVSNGFDEATITVENLTTGETIASATGDPFDATVSLTFPSQPAGSVLIITVATFASDSSDPVRVACVSSGEPNHDPLCPDGRINEYDCEPVAIYPVIDEDGYGIEVWIVEAEEKGIGRFGFFVSYAALSSLPDNPAEPIKVAQSKDGFAVLYKLPTGELQVSAGPDYEGKMFVFILEDFPNVYPTVETYLLAE